MSCLSKGSDSRSLSVRTLMYRISGMRERTRAQEAVAVLLLHWTIWPFVDGKAKDSETGLKHPFIHQRELIVTISVTVTKRKRERR